MCHSQNHFHSYFVLRESMPKMLLIVDPFVLNLNGLMPVLGQILSLLFGHRFFFAYPTDAAVAEMEANLNVYFSCQAQCKRAEINKTMPSDNVENDTRVPKCFPIVLCRHLI